MTCTDCAERIVESERIRAIPCLRCSKPMHAECAVYSEEEEAFCEHCLTIESACGTVQGDTSCAS